MASRERGRGTAGEGGRRHRLFHTLVVSGATLVPGCFTAHATPPPSDAGIEEDAAPVADAAPLDPGADAGLDGDDAAAPSEDAGTPEDAFVPPDAPDPRLCEPGWPTTKGQFAVDVEGVRYWCSITQTTPEMPDLSACCVDRGEGM